MKSEAKRPAPGRKIASRRLCSNRFAGFKGSRQAEQNRAAASSFYFRVNNAIVRATVNLSPI